MPLDHISTKRRSDLYKSMGIPVLLSVLLSAGLIYYALSGYDQKNAQTTKAITVLIGEIEGLQKAFNTLRDEVTPFESTQNRFASTTQNDVDPYESDNKDMESDLFSMRLALLEDEISIIKALIEDKEDKIGARINHIPSEQSLTHDTRNDYRDSEGEGSEGTDDATRWQIEAERDRLNEELGQLDDLMLVDAPDPEWTWMMHEKLEGALAQVVDSTDSEIMISSYDCRSALCRIETVTQNLDQSDEIEDAILDNLLEDTPRMITTRDYRENGDMITRFYLIRKGNTLEQLLLSHQ